MRSWSPTNVVLTTSLLFLGLFYLIGCTPIDAMWGGQSGEISTATPTFQAAQLVSDTPTPVSTLTVLVSPTATSRLVSPTPSPSGTPTNTPAFRLCVPLEGHVFEELHEIISDPYRPPPPGKDERHQGVDFSYYQRGERASIQGVGVQAVLAGRVSAAIKDSFPFGNLVIVETLQEDLPIALIEMLEVAPGESLYLLYAHMESPSLLEPGDPVDSCQLLGTVGKSGNAGVAHLHLETRLGPAGLTFSSMSYYLVTNTPEERENYELWRISGTFRHFDPMSLLLYEMTQ